MTRYAPVGARFWNIPLFSVRYGEKQQKTLEPLIYLRVQTFFHKTFRVYHVYHKFRLGYMCQITVIFGTLKMEFFKLISLHQTIILETLTSFKMASTLGQK